MTVCMLTLAMASAQETVSYWMEKGKELHEESSFAEAADSFEKAIEFDPNCAECWFRKGLALSYGGENADHEEAIKCYDKALQIDPTYEEALNNKGYSLGKLGMFEEGIDFINKALKINSSDADAWNNKGIIYLFEHNYNEALKCYDKAIELAPNWGDPYYNKGYTLKEMGRNTEANAYFAESGELGTGED